MKKQLLFLVNIQAGKAEIKNKALEIIDIFIKGGYEVTVYTSQKEQDLYYYVIEQGPRYPLLVCCGGDGTLNETVSGLMQLSERPLLGYIPTGTVNDFASSLGISKNPLQAASDIIQGVPFACDLGSFNQRYFSYIAAFGAFTDVAYQTPQQFKHRLGRAAYMLEAAKRLPLTMATSYRLQVEWEEGFVEDDFIFGMVTNSRSVGGFMVSEDEKIAMNDGLLEVTLIRKPQTVLEMQEIVSLLLTQYFDMATAVTFKARELTVKAAEPLPWTLDGEYGGKVLEASIQNHQQCLQILTSRDSVATLR